MAEAAGESNFFLFGLTAAQVQESRGWYDPRWHDANEPETHRALDLIRSGAFDRGEPGVFAPIMDSLLAHGDHYMHLADLASYVKTQGEAAALYRQPEAWARRAIINVGHSGKFSSDRTIMEYARGIWAAEAYPVD
jgi:starch phosphorylase